MSRLAGVERNAALLLRRGYSLTRSLVPEQGRRWLAPLASRAHRGISALESSGFRDEEARLRARLEADSENGQLWYQLGLAMDAQGRHEEAIDPLFRAAELGQALPLVTQTFQTRAPINELVSAPEHLDRMRRLAAADPESAAVQLAAGAFMLDRGEVESGRSLTQRGYELELAEHRGALATNEADQATVPSFLILGPHKTATTSLHALLTQHPQVIATPRKELHFWGKRNGRPESLYRDYFPSLSASSGLITGEATANYLQTPEAAAAAAATFPDVKTIVLRRDPVARAYSHFQMMKRLHIERREFDEAVEGEQAILGTAPPLSMEAVPEGAGPYVLGGCILPYLRMWTEALSPEQVLVIDSAYFAQHRQETLDAVFTYLGVDPLPIADEADRNVGEYSRIAPESDARLRAWFAPHEAALDEFLADHPMTIPSASDAADRSA